MEWWGEPLLICNSDFSAARNLRTRTPKLQASRRPQAYQWWAAMEWCSWAASRSARPPPRSCCASLSSHSLWRSSSSSPCSSSYSLPFDHMRTGAVPGLSRRARLFIWQPKKNKEKKKNKQTLQPQYWPDASSSLWTARSPASLCPRLPVLSCPPPDLRFDNLIKFLLFLKEGKCGRMLTYTRRRNGTRMRTTIFFHLIIRT